MKGSINSIETLGAVDGPGIRVVVFLNGCTLRCKYCHNPETWSIGPLNYTPEELVTKIKRYQPYFKNNGGVTLSGGEPLLQSKFINETIKLLKQANIHVALDTAGIYHDDIDEIITNTDLIIYDIKDITKDRYYDLTKGNIEITQKFLKLIKEKQKKVWIRQVIVPEVHDNEEYIKNLNQYIKKHFDTSLIEKIEFIPYHKLGSEKYESLNVENPYKDLLAMDIDKCNNLYVEFMKIYESKF